MDTPSSDRASRLACTPVPFFRLAGQLRRRSCSGQATVPDSSGPSGGKAASDKRRSPSERCRRLGSGASPPAARPLRACMLDADAAAGSIACRLQLDRDRICVTLEPEVSPTLPVACGGGGSRADASAAAATREAEALPSGNTASPAALAGAPAAPVASIAPRSQEVPDSTPAASAPGELASAAAGAGRWCCRRAVPMQWPVQAPGCLPRPMACLTACLTRSQGPCQAVVRSGAMVRSGQGP